MKNMSKDDEKDDDDHRYYPTIPTSTKVRYELFLLSIHLIFITHSNIKKVLFLLLSFTRCPRAIKYRR